MSLMDVKQGERVDIPALRAAGRSIQAKLGSEVIASNGRLALERGEALVRALILIGLLADLSLEAYLIWRAWKQPA